MKKLCCVLSLVVLTAASVGTAKAHNGAGVGLGFLYGQGYGNGFGFGGFNTVIRPYTPPYFSMFPPVYYGQRYTRPYGVSPYAAWPQLQSNSNYAPIPHPDRYQIIPNPHVHATGCTCGSCMAASSPAKPGLVKSQPLEPLVIENPFYQPAVRYTSAVEESSR